MTKMKISAKTVTAVAFLAILALSLVTVLTGVVRGRGSISWPAQRDYLSLVDWFEDTCRTFCTTKLPGRMTLMETNASINRMAGKWIFESTDPEVVRLHNGYLESIGNYAYEGRGIEDKVGDFADWTEENLGCPYLYIQAPSKLCALDEEEQLPMPEMTNVNQQADWLLERLEEQGVDTLDLRENLHADGLDHYGSFYVTDHHWTMPAGLWAARTMAEELNARCGWALDTDLLAAENFTDRVWEGAFLGSQGRKVTLSFADPEDFVLPIPNFETDLRLTVPPWGVDQEGGFDILWDENKIVPADYYTGNSYGAVLKGDCPYIKVENRQNPDGPVIAVLRESFAIAPSPYLSLTAGELHLIDPRYYVGSVKELLEEIQPDIVVSLLNVQCHTGAYFDMIK